MSESPAPIRPPAPRSEAARASRAGLVGAAWALALGGCIAVQRPAAPHADATTAGDTGDATAVDTVDGDANLETSDQPETDDSGDTQGDAGCSSPASCPAAPPNSCSVATCIDGACGVGPASDGTDCDDGQPCLTGDMCKGGACVPGANEAGDGTSCDDGTFCSSLDHCENGVCILSAVSPCAAIEPSARCVHETCVPSGMVPVPDGTFLMGCDPGNAAVGKSCPDHTDPEINVFLSAYAIDQTEVSEGAHMACVASGFCMPRDDVAIAPEVDRPAVDIDFNQAKALCAYLGKRLCRETEWEKAARGGAGRRIYPWGSEDPDCTRANFTSYLPQQHTCSTNPDFGTVPIDESPAGASPYGALNMLGNAREWVEDSYVANIYDAWRTAALQTSGLVTNPPAPETDAGGRVVRGQGYKNAASELRLDARSAESPTTHDFDLGVRCCADLPLKPTASNPP